MWHLVEDVGNREAMYVWGQEAISVPSSQFCHEPKTYLKSKVTKLKISFKTKEKIGEGKKNHSGGGKMWQGEVVPNLNGLT